MSFIEEIVVSKAVPYVLEKLNERNTWITWIGLAGAHFGGVINPDLSPLLVNAATAFFAVVGFVAKGAPIFTAKEKK